VPPRNDTTVILKSVEKPVRVKWKQASSFDQSTAVTVGDTATLIAAENTERNSIILQNTGGANACYLGNSSVTDSDGYWLPPGGEASFDKTTAAIYGICGAGLSTTVRILEL